MSGARYYRGGQRRAVIHGAAVPAGGSQVGGASSTDIVSYKQTLKYDGSQNIFAHSMVLINNSLEVVNDASGRPITYLSASKTKMEGVPNEIKNKARITMKNVIKTPQTNNLERVSEDEYFCDEYDECSDKLSVIDYLDPSYTIELKKPDKGDDYSKYRYNRAINLGYKYEVKQYALTDAYDYITFSQAPPKRDLPEGIAYNKYKLFYDFFVDNWKPDKMKYVLDNFYNYQRMEAVVDLFFEIARLTAYYIKNNESIILYRLPQFKYLELQNFCRKHYFVEADCKKALTTDQRNYYGFYLIDTLEEICERETYDCPNGKTNAENLRKEDLAESYDESDCEDDDEFVDDDSTIYVGSSSSAGESESKEVGVEVESKENGDAINSDVIGFDLVGSLKTGVDTEIERVVEDCGSSFGLSADSGNGNDSHEDFSPVEQLNSDATTWEEMERTWDTEQCGNGNGAVQFGGTYYGSGGHNMYG